MEEKKTAKYYKRTKLYKAIREDLLDQLERKCIYGKQFKDLVEDYMSFWVIKCMLINDIESRGVSVIYNHGGGQKGYKKNDSVGELNKINGQMLKILNELGIKVTVTESDEDEL